MKATRVCEAACLDVWNTLRISHQELAHELEALGLITEQALAEWVCHPLESNGRSPVELIEGGRGAEVPRRINQAIHGVFLSRGRVPACHGQWDPDIGLLVRMATATPASDWSEPLSISVRIYRH